MNKDLEFAQKLRSQAERITDRINDGQIPGHHLKIAMLERDQLLEDAEYYELQGAQKEDA